MARIGIGQQPRAHGQRGQPLGVEAGGAQGSLRLGLQVGVLAGQVPGGLQVRIDGLAGNDQVHDFGGALEDPVDPQVALQLLHRDRAFAAGPLGSAVS